MKRRLLLAIGVLALTATSQQIFAAESETAAPQERERAPARERAAPARQLQRAPVQRQAAPSSQSSSFTGSQAGGFGGGNTGGGGFADPAFCGATLGFAIGFSPSCGQTSQNVGRATGFAGGAEYGYMFPVGPYAAAGFAVDVTGSTLKSSSTQTTSKFVSLTGDRITETLSTSQSQPVTSTLRAKIGFVPVAMGLSNVMVFATAGGAVGRVSGSFTYSANNFATPPITPATAFGASSWDVTRVGYVVGGGVTVRYPLVAVTLEYLYTNLGTITQNTPLVATAATGCVPLSNTSCTSFAQTSMKTDTSTVRLKLSLPL